MSNAISVAMRGEDVPRDGGLTMRRQGKILVATSDAAQRAAAAQFLTGRGYAFVTAQSNDEVRRHLKAGGIDLVVTAMLEPDGEGFEPMRVVREALPGVPVIVVALGEGELDSRQLDCAAGLKRDAAGGQDVLARLASLTARERQVLNLIVAGRANKVIAYELAISPRTVENHRARVMDKLRVKSVAELVRIALSAEDIEARQPRLRGANDTGDLPPFNA